MCPKKVRYEDYDIKLDNTILERVSCFKFLGIWIDEKLTYSEHTTKVINKLSSVSFLLYKLRYILNRGNLILLFNAIGLSQIFYGDVIYLNACNQTLFNLVNSKYIDSGRIILFNRKGSSHKTTLAILHWQKLKTLLLVHKLIFLFKCINNKSSHLLTISFNPVDHSYATRTSANSFVTPFMSTNRGKNAFYYWGPFIWNKLPNHIKQITSITTFKKEALSFARTNDSNA